MSRSQQDQFIDDDEEEETCPLCIEEFDLTDKNFRPCPCGYQICQFCYNNIKTTMNGQCPACRRPYDEKNIQWRVVSPEEMLLHKQNLAQQAKKKAAARQKEAQKREADNLSRKHLAGLRVRQKNLVYVTGLKPRVHGERLVEGLRGSQFFGQYGEIVKIVVSKSKDTTQPIYQQPVGVYVTFAKKEDAAACIAAINSRGQGDDGRIRAQYGTTKYCSAYLRNETCNNRNCMFLHEPGEENESFTRQDLSSLNAISSQQPPQNPTPTQPPQQLYPIAAAAQPSQDHSEAVASPVDGCIDVSALPATASWGDQLRRASRTSASTHSPLATNSTPAPQPNNGKASEEQDNIKDTEAKPAQDNSSDSIMEQPGQSTSGQKVLNQQHTFFDDLVNKAFNPDIKLSFSAAHLPEHQQKIIERIPPLFDLSLGPKRRLRTEQEAEEARRRQEETQVELKSGSSEEAEESQPTAGSSQLGGEPEERPERGFGQTIMAPQQAIGSSYLGLNQNFPGDDLPSLGSSRSLISQHSQQQLLLQQLKMAGFPSGSGQQPSGNSHGRQSSRFAFLNDGPSGPSVKQHASNAMKQGNYAGSLGQHQGLGGQIYSSVQGPPPGLKTAGTPPVSGMFGPGHRFSTPSAGYASGQDNDKLWDFHRTRGNAGGNLGPDAGKREFMFPSYHQYPSTSSTPAPGVLGFPYGSQASGPYQDAAGPQKPRKKGKKPKHTNTSSSGGGVVDVADPSILQMRVGGAMAGQGPYAGQGQGGFPSLHGNAYSRGW